MQSNNESIREEKEGFYKRNEKFLKILILGILVRIITFFFIFVVDITYFVKASTFLVNGVNPYETNSDFFCKYPPFFYYLITLFGLLTTFSYFGPKLMVVCFDSLNIIIIYKLGGILKDRNLGLNISILYAFNPIIIVSIYHDVNEFITLFFTLVSVYYLILKKNIISSIFLALGIGFKLYPAFFLIPITAFIYKNSTNSQKGVINVFLYYIIIFLTLFFISLPFLFFSPVKSIECFLIHTNRRNLGYSLVEIFPYLTIFYDIKVSIFNFSVSLQFIIQVAIFLSIFAFLLVGFKKFSITDLFGVMVIITVLLSLLTYQIQNKYTNLMSFPFLLFILYKDRRSILKSETIFRFLNVLLPVLVFIFIFLLIYPPIGNLIQMDLLFERGFIYTIFWLVSFFIFIFYEIKLKNEGEYKIHLLNVLPMIAFLVINNIFGAIIIILMLVGNVFYTINKFWFKDNSLILRRDFNFEFRLRDKNL